MKTNASTSSVSRKGNVLVIGGSGVGKSTLINAVLGEDVAPTSWGRAGTEELKIYGDESSPFRLIDTMGFEPSAKRQKKASNAIKRWSRDCAKEGNEDTQINVIWFCIDGTAARLFTETIEQLNDATAIWKTVPVVAVITKSYSEYEREENTRMVRHAFERSEKADLLDKLFRKPDYSKRLKGIVPVVAQTWRQSDTNIVATYGIDELIELTNKLMPEDLEHAQVDLQDFVMKRNKALAQGIIVPCVAAGAAVGALPLPIADAMVLAPVEATEVNAIAKLYGLDKRDEFQMVRDTIVDVGTVSMAAKGAISVLKAIPGIQVAAEIINATVAASFIAALGEGCVYLFERICTGQIDSTDLDEIREYFERVLQSQDFINKVTEALKSLKDGADPDAIARAVSILFAKPANKVFAKPVEMGDSERKE